MKTLLIVFLLCADCSFGYAQSKLYVAGDSEAAIETRRVLGRTACFDLASDQKAAVLTLKINEHDAPGGLNAMFALGKMPSTTVVTGQLLDRDGKVLWEDSKQGPAGFVHDGAGAGAHNLIRSLWKSQGCSKRDGSKLR